MMKTNLFKGIFLILFLSLMINCSNNDKNGTVNNLESKMDSKVSVPSFDENNAYLYIKKQVSFGPRIPNSKAQKECSKFLLEELKKSCDTSYLQFTTVVAYNGISLPCYNIIARIHPENKRKIILSAHWDTRPWSDQEKDQNLKKDTFQGANDGGSGTAILLELAKVFAKNNPKVCIEIVLYDVEDFGTPYWESQEVREKENKYCLGSQAFAKSINKSKYYADCSINLDMVGGKDAIFTMEGYSTMSAPAIVDYFWKSAGEAGYNNYFPIISGSPITDDHVNLSEIAGIPSIDILDYDPRGERYFNPTWHTKKDNLSNIDKATLKAVGNSILYFVYHYDKYQ